MPTEVTWRWPREEDTTPLSAIAAVAERIALDIEEGVLQSIAEQQLYACHNGTTQDTYTTMFGVVLKNVGSRECIYSKMVVDKRCTGCKNQQAPDLTN